MNINKELLFKTLEIENTTDYIRRTINKLNGKIEERTEKNKFVECLSIKSIKFRLNWLFNSHNRAHKWNWNQIISNDHVVKQCPKTQKWRDKWNQKLKDIANREPIETLMYECKNEKNLHRVSSVINCALEELVKDYLI